MADSPSSRDGDAAGAPRWAKVLGIVALVLVVLLVALLLAGGGSHGPDRHLGSDRSPARVTEDRTASGGDLAGHTPPAGGRAP